MTIEIRPMDGPLGAEVFGLDMARPLSGDDVARLRAAWHHHQVLVLRELPPPRPEDHIAFTRYFGDCELITQPQYTLPGMPEIFVNSNSTEKGKDMGQRKVGRGWHSDSEFLPAPSAGSVLVSYELPPDGGDTLFASMTAAYDALPEALRRRIEDLWCLYSRIRWFPVHYAHLPPLTEAEKAKLPDVVHPLVKVHPVTEQRSLAVGRYIWSVLGMEEEAGRALARELIEHATSDRFTYRHRWQTGDALMWDNRSCLHKAEDYDEERHVRHMHRTTIQGTMPIPPAAMSRPPLPRPEQRAA
jgi:alpha-ketoglutarate-dependent taurine dioxygenase